MTKITKKVGAAHTNLNNIIDKTFKVSVGLAAGGLAAEKIIKNADAVKKNLKVIKSRDEILDKNGSIKGGAHITDVVKSILNYDSRNFDSDHISEIKTLANAVVDYCNTDAEYTNKLKSVTDQTKVNRIKQKLTKLIGDTENKASVLLRKIHKDVSSKEANAYGTFKSKNSSIVDRNISRVTRRAKAIVDKNTKSESYKAAKERHENAVKPISDRLKKSIPECAKLFEQATKALKTVIKEIPNT